jgi:hypothetical protein
VIRAHIQNYLNINKYTDVNEFINDSSIVSEEMIKNLKNACFGNIPESLDGFDITKSFALIRNVINKLDKSKFNYDRSKYEFCKQLKDIRNVKYAHLLAFEMDDVDFSVTVATLEEVIRQLCHFNKETSAKYLREVEDELEKDSSQLNRSDVIKLLAEQTQEIESKLDIIINKLDKPEAYVIGLASNLPPCPPASKLYNRENEDEIFKKLAEHRMSCIAGMAGVGKSTLAITYGYHRRNVNEAKVCISEKIQKNRLKCYTDKKVDISTQKNPKVLLWVWVFYKSNCSM